MKNNTIAILTVLGSLLSTQSQVFAEGRNRSRTTVHEVNQEMNHVTGRQETRPATEAPIHSVNRTPANRPNAEAQKLDEKIACEVPVLGSGSSHTADSLDDLLDFAASSHQESTTGFQWAQLKTLLKDGVVTLTQHSDAVVRKGWQVFEQASRKAIAAVIEKYRFFDTSIKEQMQYWRKMTAFYINQMTGTQAGENAVEKCAI
jgi:hypothetical protein